MSHVRTGCTTPLLRRLGLLCVVDAVVVGVFFPPLLSLRRPKVYVFGRPQVGYLAVVWCCARVLSLYDSSDRSSEGVLSTRMTCQHLRYHAPQLRGSCALCLSPGVRQIPHPPIQAPPVMIFSDVKKLSPGCAFICVVRYCASTLLCFVWSVLCAYICVCVLCVQIDISIHLHPAQAVVSVPLPPRTLLFVRVVGAVSLCLCVNFVMLMFRPIYIRRKQCP